MGRDAAASRRLVAQHYLFGKIFGWSLHPSVTARWTVQGPSVPRKIADVACGNGIWALDQAATDLSGFDQLEFTGFDISDAQYPHPDTWPKNVNFELWDVKTPPPQRFRQYFDVVHVRLISCAVSKEEEIAIIFQNLQQLLKPGGYLQWLESDLLAGPQTAAHSSNSIVKTFADELWSVYGISTYATKWVGQLPDIFSKAGWTVVDNIRASPPVWLRKHMWDNQSGALTELVEGTGSPEIEKKFAAFLKEVAKYPQDPPIWISQLVLCQKPVAAVAM